MVANAANNAVSVGAAGCWVGADMGCQCVKATTKEVRVDDKARKDEAQDE